MLPITSQAQAGSLILSCLQIVNHQRGLLAGWTWPKRGDASGHWKSIAHGLGTAIANLVRAQRVMLIVRAGCDGDSSGTAWIGHSRRVAAPGLKAGARRSPLQDVPSR